MSYRISDAPFFSPFLRPLRPISCMTLEIGMGSMIRILVAKSPSWMEGEYLRRKGFKIQWWGRPDVNRGPPALKKTCALMIPLVG
jgi:hypothetical protein